MKVKPFDLTWRSDIGPVVLHLATEIYDRFSHHVDVPGIPVAIEEAAVKMKSAISFIAIR